MPRARSFFFFLSTLIITFIYYEFTLAIWVWCLFYFIFFDSNGFQNQFQSALVDYVIPRRQLSLLVQHIKRLLWASSRPPACLPGWDWLGPCWEHSFAFTLASSCPQLNQEMCLGVSLECWEQRAEGRVCFHPSVHPSIHPFIHPTNEYLAPAAR